MRYLLPRIVSVLNAVSYINSIPDFVINRVECISVVRLDNTSVCNTDVMAPYRLGRQSNYTSLHCGNRLCQGSAVLLLG
jgi:hypothetical protein